MKNLMLGSLLTAQTVMSPISSTQDSGMIKDNGDYFNAMMKAVNFKRASVSSLSDKHLTFLLKKFHLDKSYRIGKNPTKRYLSDTYKMFKRIPHFDSPFFPEAMQERANSYYYWILKRLIKDESYNRFLKHMFGAKDRGVRNDQQVYNRNSFIKEPIAFSKTRGNEPVVNLSDDTLFGKTGFILEADGYFKDKGFVPKDYKYRVYEMSNQTQYNLAFGAVLSSKYKKISKKLKSDLININYSPIKALNEFGKEYLNKWNSTGVLKKENLNFLKNIGIFKILFDANTMFAKKYNTEKDLAIAIGANSISNYISPLLNKDELESKNAKEIHDYIINFTKKFIRLYNNIVNYKNVNQLNIKKFNKAYSKENNNYLLQLVDLIIDKTKLRYGIKFKQYGDILNNKYYIAYKVDKGLDVKTQYEILSKKFYGNAHIFTKYNDDHIGSNTFYPLNEERHWNLRASENESDITNSADSIY